MELERDLAEGFLLGADIENPSDEFEIGEPELEDDDEGDDDQEDDEDDVCEHGVSFDEDCEECEELEDELDDDD